MLKNCKRCKKLFTVNENMRFIEFCGPCRCDIKHEIDTLNTFIKDEISITISDLCLRSKISEKKVNEYISSGKVVAPLGYK
ncbi:MAG: hypothetical protein ACK5LT_05495 [Lachnospirales bacterium]